MNMLLCLNDSSKAVLVTWLPFTWFITYFVFSFTPRSIDWSNRKLRTWKKKRNTFITNDTLEKTPFYLFKSINVINYTFLKNVIQFDDNPDFSRIILCVLSWLTFVIFEILAIMLRSFLFNLVELGAWSLFVRQKWNWSSQDLIPMLRGPRHKPGAGPLSPPTPLNQ